MKKKKAIRNYILVSISVVILLLLSIFSFSIPFTNYIFKGFVSGLDLGLDLGGGVSAIYEVETADWYTDTYDKAMDSAINRVQEILDREYPDAKVYRVDDDKIKMVVPDQGISSHYVVGLLEMKAEAGAEAEAMVTGADIKDCYYMYDSTSMTHGVYIEFTDEGKTKFAELTKTVAGAEGSQGGSMYIYMNKDYDNPFSQPTVNQEITAGYTFISGAGITNKSSGEAYAEKFISSKLGVNMSIVGEDIEVGAIYGDSAKVATLMIIIFFILVAFGIFYLLYRELGFVEMLSFVFSCLLTLLGLCLIDVKFTSFSAIGLLLGYALNMYLHMYYVGNIKKEYSAGKKLSISIREGYSKSLVLMIEMLIVALGISLLGIFISSGVVESLCIAFAISTIPTAFTSLFINRVLVLNYNAFNLNDGKKCNFTKEEANNETK